MKLPKKTKQQYIVIGSVAGISVMAAMVVAIVFVHACKRFKLCIL